MSMDPCDWCVVNFLFDFGYSPATVLRIVPYGRLRNYAARLLADQGALDDVLYDGMPDIERDLVLILADYLQSVYRHLERV